MARNFIISFFHREGSSAIIDHLSNHPKLNVPLFEGLDNYAANSHANAFEIVEFVDQAFSQGSCDLPWVEENKFSMTGPKKAYECIGFKWRIWGDTNKISEILCKHKVKLFFLMRNDPFDLALSLYLTNRIIPRLEDADAFGGGGHVQFTLRQLPQARVEAAKNRLSKIEFQADREGFLSYIEEYVKRKQRDWNERIFPLLNRGINVSLISYEKFLQDPKMFLRDFLNTIDLPWDDAVTETEFVKVTSANLFHQVENLQDLRDDSDVRRWQEIYRAFQADVVAQLASADRGQPPSGHRP